MQVSRSQGSLSESRAAPSPRFSHRAPKISGAAVPGKCSALEGAGRSWPNPTITGPARICRSKVWALPLAGLSWPLHQRPGSRGADAA